MGKRKRRLERKMVRERRNKVLVKGVFSSAQAGFGFVNTEDGKEVFIPARFVGNAIDGDTVEAEITDSGDPRGPSGKVESVLQRGRALVVCEVLNPYTVSPLDKTLPHELKVSGGVKGAQRGDWVQVRLLDSGSKNTERLRGQVESRIGKAATVKGDLEAVSREYDMPEPYSDSDNAAALRLAPVPVPREDRRSVFTVTIDPADAKDFDDAVSVEDSPKEWIVGVHIADVAAWIRPGSRFDKTASVRGFSSYIPAMFRPMLPKALTEKISLRQDAGSFAHTFELHVNKRTGKVVSYRRFHSLIRVDHRLNYGEVQSFLDGKTPESWDSSLTAGVELLSKAAFRMRQYRAKTEGFLEIDSPETRIQCNPDTFEILGMETRSQTPSESIIEEFMLAANSAAANELITKGIPGLFRIHDEPDPAKLAEFESFAEEILKRSPGDLSNRENVRHFLSALPDNHMKGVITNTFLRTMARAVYSQEPSLHYGLGKTRYSHFTSPIRRYSDLFTHQQLLAYDRKERMRSKKIAETIAGTLVKLELRNDNAYFAACDRLKLHYMKQLGLDENGHLFEGVVVKNSGGGIVCDVPEYGIRGFVPAKFPGVRTKRPPRPGDIIYLLLDGFDFAHGSAVFRPSI